MMYYQASLVFALLSPACFGFKAEIRADTNRDGVVDVTSDTDVNGKDAWTESSGAIFLANIGDTDRRCSKQALQVPESSDEELAACNDASDDILRQAEYLAPMKTLPMPDLGDAAVGMVSANPLSSKHVRIFQQGEGDSWTIVSANTTFTSAQLKVGLTLGIDARDTRRPGGWDGRTTVMFSVTDGATNSTDKVMLRVAPVLSHNHLQRVDQVLTSSGFRERQAKFVTELSRIVASKGITKPVFVFDHWDIWTQDFVEPGYTSMPGPNGTISMRIMIRSGQIRESNAGRLVFEYLRGTGVGAVYHPGGIQDSISSTGNFETIPPYEHNGTKYPAGRIIMGSDGYRTSHDFEYMRAQEVQNPLTLDTDWLVVGHVDEFVQFVPANTTRGWAIVVDDPESGLELLRGVQRKGLGSMRAFSRTSEPGAVMQFRRLESVYKSMEMNSGGERNTGYFTFPVPEETVDEVLANKTILDVNAMSARRISKNIAVLKEATGVTDEEIYHLPAVFWTYSRNIFGQPSGRVDAYYPGIINGVVLSETDYLAPRPWGPLVDGKDVFEEAARLVYAKAGLTVTFMDDWYTHHIVQGEIHCGTNTIRQKDQPWW